MKLLNKCLLTSAVAGALALASCKPNVGEPCIDKEEMVSLLVDVQLAQSLVMRQTTVPPNMLQRDRYYKSVLDKHHVTEAQFDSAVSWYARNAGVYKEVYQAVLDTLQNRRNRF